MLARSRSLRRWTLIANAMLFSAALALCTEPQSRERATSASEDDLDFFESRVRPLFAEKCYGCHSSAAEKLKGGLRLDTREAILAGGASGPVIVAGDPDASLLIQAVRYGGDVQMPPKGKLDDASIDVLVAWVRRGAPLPDARAAGDDESARSASSDHWAFQRIADPAPPEVAGELWCRNDIDRFVLARLEAQGLAPAPEADRRTLLRRLCFDLIGLPPTDEELELFERDASPDAWGKQIDRLLASPHYGERWGRYWLDLARYSDSNGLDENLAMSNAWRYRDWVVRAFNEDLPYDSFVTYQLAGDLLPEPADERELRDRLIATGFLVLGPKMLAEQDKAKLVLDVVDEQLDVTFRALTGLTLGCARCHDHKFDPISQRDYYAVAGVFKSTATMANTNFVSRWNERELAPRAAIEARNAAIAARDAARKEHDELRARADDELLARWTADSSSYLLAGTEAARGALLVEAEESSRGNLIADKDQFGSEAVTVARTSREGEQFAEYDLTFAEGGSQQLEIRMAAEESRPMRVLLEGHVVFESVLGEVTGSWKPDGQRWFRLGAIAVRAGRNVLRLERASGSVPHLDQLLFVPIPEGRALIDWPIEGNPWASGLAPSIVRAWASYVEVAERRSDRWLSLWTRFARLDAANFDARAAELTAQLREERSAGRLDWNPLVLGLLDGLPPTSLRELAGRYQTLLSSVDRVWRERKQRDAAAEKLDDAAEEALRQVVHGPASPFRLPAAEIGHFYSAPKREQIDAARAQVDQLERATPPEFDSALAVRDAEKPENVPLLRRGNHLDQSDGAIPRGTLAIFESLVPPAPISESESGRLQLAQSLASPEHPLTSRVISNRLWQGHFGDGLVRSSSNFGLRGETPSHPELLDWLAREIVRRGWSLKAMHRLICSSATYRMSSAANDAAAMKDPENRLLWRHSRRRLEAESIRDSMLAASGQLDRALGGSLVEAKNGDYITNDQSKLAARFDAPRRSLYLPVVRNAMLDLFAAFDYLDPSVTVEQRPQTTSPSQALYLMNSPLVIDASRTIADAATAEDARGRVDALYRRALSRPARDHEVERALRFVERLSRPSPNVSSAADVGQPAVDVAPAPRDASEREAWRALAQVLLVSNEFLFVD